MQPKKLLIEELSYASPLPQVIQSPVWVALRDLPEYKGAHGFLEFHRVNLSPKSEVLLRVSDGRHSLATADQLYELLDSSVQPSDAEMHNMALSKVCSLYKLSSF